MRRLHSVNHDEDEITERALSFQLSLYEVLFGN